MTDPTEEKLKEYKEAFEMFDRDQDGLLSQEDLGYALMCLGLNFSQNELISTMDEFGKNNSIDFEHFSSFLLKRSTDPEMEEELIECFKDIDKDNDGKITKKELKYFLITMGEQMLEEELDEMINVIDTKGEGYIAYPDFVKLLLAK